METSNKAAPAWQQFERLVARIEADAGPLGLTVTSPDRIRCKITGRLREVDATVRTKVGTTNLFVTIECRKRRPKQDVTWIEQLATKKSNLGAARTIAVSATGFSKEAQEMASYHGIDLRHLSEVTTAEINQLLQIDFVLFPHKRCSISRVAVRWFRSLDWRMPDPENLDYELPPTDLHRPIFINTETGARWSVNDLWYQLQAAADPFAGVDRDGKPVIRTACFPYPGNVAVETPEGRKQIGEVLLSVALAIEVEQVTLATAKKVEYAGPSGETLQRVEFTSQEPGREDWRISLQASKDAAFAEQIRTTLNLPAGKPMI